MQQRVVYSVTWVVGVAAATTLGLVAVSSAQSKLLAPQRLAIASIRDLERSEQLALTRLGENERLTQDDLAAELAFANEVDWVDPVPVLATEASPSVRAVAPSTLAASSLTSVVPSSRKPSKTTKPKQTRLEAGRDPVGSVGAVRTDRRETTPRVFGGNGTSAGTKLQPSANADRPQDRTAGAAPITVPKQQVSRPTTTKRVRTTKAPQSTSTLAPPVALAPAEPAITAPPTTTPAPAPAPTTAPTIAVVPIPQPGDPAVVASAITTPGVTVYAIPVPAPTPVQVPAPAPPTPTVVSVVPGTVAPTPVSVAPTTAAPTTVAPTTAAPTTAPPTTAPPTTAPTTTAKPTSAVYNVALGSISVHCNGTSIVLDYAVPNSGASVSVKQGNRQLTAKFVQNGKRSEIQISCASGTPSAEVDEKN